MKLTATRFSCSQLLSFSFSLFFSHVSFFPPLAPPLLFLFFFLFWGPSYPSLVIVRELQETCRLFMF